MKKKVVLLFCLFLLFNTSGIMAAENPAEVYLKEVLKQLHLAENFQGEILTRINLHDTILTYRIGLLKDGTRTDYSADHTFWQLKGTDIGRMIGAIPWFYLPPDYYLLQNALPIQRRSIVEEPLLRIGYDYEVEILSEDENTIVFGLNNGYVFQEVMMNREKKIITEIKVLNAAKKLMAVIEYVNWKEYYSGVLLPETIRVSGDDGRMILEMVFVNWKVNQGVDSFARTLPDAWNKAVDNLRTDILENPADDDLHFKLAMLYKQQSFWNNALEELDKALALNPKLEYREEMAKIYQTLGEYEEAVNQLLVVLEKGENGARYFLLGTLYDKINNPMLAQDAYERAVEFENLNFIYWERLFWSYRNISSQDKRMQSKAIQAGEKLVEIKPDSYQYMIYLGDLYLENNLLDQAFEQFEQARSLEPEESLPVIKLARYCEKIGDLEGALSAFKDATRIDEHWWNYLQLGDFYLRQAQIEEALVAYEQSLQMNPRNTDLNIKLGKVFWQMGREADAKEYWYQALQYEETNIYTYIRVGEILLQYNLVQEAEEIFDRAIERFQMLGDQSLQPGLSQIYEKIGLLHVEADPIYALQCFEKAYQFQPGSISGLYLGLKELKQGNLNLAINFWTEATLLEGDEFEAYILLTVVKGLRGEVLGSQSKELDSINQYLTVEERELMNKFFSYFTVIRTLKNEDENTPDEAKIAFTAGMEAFMKGNLNQAVEDLQQAIELDRHYRKGHFFLGIIYSLMGQSEEAQKHFTMIQNDYAGSYAARVAGTIDQSIKRLFWKIKI